MMIAEDVLARMVALDWLLTRVLADGIATAPLPRRAAERFRSMCLTEGGALTDRARDAGDTDEGRIAAAVASSSLDVKQRVINLAAAGAADSGGAAN